MVRRCCSIGQRRTDKNGNGLLRNERAVALLLALVVTALLIALIFEFAYAARISLRSAVNFRDSERAYYLARSGVFLFLKRSELRDLIPEKEWGVVPVVSRGDTELRIRWEDEKGKISIYDLTKPESETQVRELFRLREVSTELFDRMKDRVAERRSPFRYLGELHEVATEEEFSNIRDVVSVRASRDINIATAAEDVLRSAGVGEATLAQILSDRRAGTLKPPADYGLSPVTFTDRSSHVTIFSSATVGEYTKTIEAIVEQNRIYYWKVQ